MKDIKRKARVIKWLLISGIFLIVLTLGFVKTVMWFDDHKVILQKPVTITFNKPVQIVKRELLKPTVIEIANELPELKDLTPIEKYICDKWGAYQCAVAIAVFKAESGLREDAYNVNDNGSIDLGVAQINSVHWNKPGCALKDLVDQYKNVDCAYQIYEASGWNAWTVFKTGSFKNNL